MNIFSAEIIWNRYVDAYYADDAATVRDCLARMRHCSEEDKKWLIDMVTISIKDIRDSKDIKEDYCESKGIESTTKSLDDCATEMWDIVRRVAEILEVEV